MTLYNRKKHILYKDKFIEKVEEIDNVDSKKLERLSGD